MTRFFLTLTVFIAISFTPQTSRAEPGKEETPVVIILEHSWQLEEEWDKIKKTKYSWWATVKNLSEISQEVSIYYSLLDKDGFPLARNTRSQTVGPLETVEITSDSYIHNQKIPQAVSSRATLKSRPLR